MFAYVSFKSTMNKVEILTIDKTLLDASFPPNQFLIKGFHQPFWLDSSRNNVGLLIHIKSSLSVKFLSNYTFPFSIHVIPFEFNFLKKKMAFY